MCNVVYSLIEVLLLINSESVLCFINAYKLPTLHMLCSVCSSDVMANSVYRQAISWQPLF